MCHDQKAVVANGRSVKTCVILLVLLGQLFAVLPAPAYARPLHSWLLSELLTHMVVNSDEYSTLLHELTCGRVMQMVSENGNAKMTSVKPTMTVSYGGEQAQNFDVYAPLNDQGPAPMIVMVHGGAWCTGDKRLDQVVTNKVAHWLPKGFVFISVNYRMLPDGANAMMQAGDVAKALAYIETHAAQWNGNPAEIVLMGHSAGGHLVSRLSAEPSLAAQYGANPWLGTISLDSATLDIDQVMQNPHPMVYDEAFGQTPADWMAASPIKHLSLASLPWLGVCSIIHEDSCRQTRAFVEKALKYGVKSRMGIEKLSHNEIDSQLGKPGKMTYAVDLFMGSLNADIRNRLRQY